MRLELLSQGSQGLRVLGCHQEPGGSLVQAVHDARADHPRLALARQPGGLRIQISIPICSKAVALIGLTLSSTDWACWGEPAVCRAAWRCLYACKSGRRLQCQGAMLQAAHMSSCTEAALQGHLGNPCMHVTVSG